MIRWAAREAAALVTVSAALRERLVELGAAPDAVHVLRNGVDLERFHPVDRAAARRALGLAGTTLLMVGNLVPLKGHALVIEALAQLPEIALLIVGAGPEEDRLRRLAEETGVGERVRFLGRIPHERLAGIYGAADALVLASSREGWPNVLLEAMACATPVVATRVGGVPECVEAPEAGELVEERTAEAIAAAVRRLLARRPDRDATRRYAERFGWEQTTAGQLRVFREALRMTAGEALCASS
jgi:glycosyltransferase involved in cell wall biosynthesis